MPKFKKVYNESYRSGFYHPISILILALITLTVALAIFANSGFFANKNVPTPPSPTPQPSPKPSPKTSPADETTNWKTINFNEVGLSFKYPPDKLFLEFPEKCFRTGGKIWVRLVPVKPPVGWENTEGIKDCIVPGEDGTQFEVNIYPNEIDTKPIAAGESKKIQVAGIEANLIYNTAPLGGEGGSLIKFNKSGKGYMIHIPAESSGPGSKIDPLFDLILSTFQFLN